MNHHADKQAHLGSARAKLVYGRQRTGDLAHITEVRRGFGCDCVCPTCFVPLVARTKDEHRTPHFAHSSNRSCDGGLETVLHLLAKEVFRGGPSFLLPERQTLDTRNLVATKPSREVQVEFVRMEDTSGEGVIPDLRVRALGHDLLVEIAVTHFTDDAKTERLRKRGIPAVEVDLSRLARDSPRETIADAVLRTAPRRWLFHPGIDAVEAKRRDEEERWRIERERRRERMKKMHRKRVDDLVLAYRSATATGWGSIPVPRLSELEAAGIAQMIGLQVTGGACFLVPGNVWQAVVLTEAFQDGCLDSGLRNPVSITRHLERRGLIRSAFRRVYKDLEEDATAVEPKFAPPWRAVETYLNRLVEAGVVVRHGYGLTLERRLAGRWAQHVRTKRIWTDATERIALVVDWILSQLPPHERGCATASTWLESLHPESGLSFRQAIQSSEVNRKIAENLDAIVTMLDGRGPLPFGTAGLPVEGAVERRRRQMDVEAE